LTDIKKSSNVGVKHEYVELEVNEISVVDRPANEEEFAVIKCVMEDEMPDKKEDIEKNIDKKNEKTEDVKKEEEQKQMQNLDDVLKKISDIESKIESLKKDEKVQKEIDWKDELVAKGVDGKILKMIEDKFNQKEKVKKESENSLIGELTTELTKAKTFTPSRIKRLEDASQLLSRLMEEITQINQKPNDLSSHSDSQSMETGNGDVKKNFDDMNKNFFELCSVVKALKEKVEAIEKIRQPSTSLDKQENEDVKKSDDFWSGVFNN